MAITYLPNNEYQKLVSRYKKYRVISNDNDKEIYLETFNQFKNNLTDSDIIYHIVRKNEVNRLDIIANNFYNSASLWWIIALVNMVIDPFTIPEGMVLTIPSISSLYRNQILV